MIPKKSYIGSHQISLLFKSDIFVNFLFITSIYHIWAQYLLLPKCFFKPTYFFWLNGFILKRSFISSLRQMENQHC